MKTFKQLTNRFGWVNPSILDNFPLKDRGLTDYKLFQFSYVIESEEVIKEMAKEGYVPANLYELLTWKDWNEKDRVVALGSVAEVNGDRDVPFLSQTDAKRLLDLRWWRPVQNRF